MSFFANTIVFTSLENRNRVCNFMFIKVKKRRFRPKTTNRQNSPDLIPCDYYLYENIFKKQQRID